MFFDDLQKSDTYAEQVEYCPACGRPLERKALRMLGPAHEGAASKREAGCSLPLLPQPPTSRHDMAANSSGAATARLQDRSTLTLTKRALRCLAALCAWYTYIRSWTRPL